MPSFAIFKIEITFALLECTIQWVLVYLQGYTTITSNSRIFHPPKRSPVPTLSSPRRPRAHVLLWIHLLWTCHGNAATPCGLCVWHLTKHRVQGPSPRSACQGLILRGCVMLPVWMDGVYPSMHPLTGIYPVSAFWLADPCCRGHALEQLLYGLVCSVPLRGPQERINGR